MSIIDDLVQVAKRAQSSPPLLHVARRDDFTKTWPPTGWHGEVLFEGRWLEFVSLEDYVGSVFYQGDWVTMRAEDPSLLEFRLKESHKQ